MLKLFREALRDLETFRSQQAEIRQHQLQTETVLQDSLQDVRALQQHLVDLDAKVDREVLNMAELYGKTYRLLKRMQAEERHDGEEEPPDITPPAERVADPVTERVLARRAHGVSKQREG